MFHINYTVSQKKYTTLIFTITSEKLDFIHNLNSETIGGGKATTFPQKRELPNAIIFHRTSIFQ